MTAGRGTQIDQVDMVTSAFGYGVVANDPFHPRSWIYLVRTSDAGSSWSMQSALPYPSFHQSGGELVPRIDFVSRLVGYVASRDGAIPGALFVTTNGGLTWSKVVTPGVTPTFMATAYTLAVVTTCACTRTKNRTSTFVPMTCRSIGSVPRHRGERFGFLERATSRTGRPVVRRDLAEHVRH